MAPDFFIRSGGQPVRDDLQESLVETQIRFGVGFEIGAATDVLLIQEDLRHGIDRLAGALGQIFFGDAFGVYIHVAEFEVIALFGQLLGDLYGTDTVGATRATKNHCKHIFSPFFKPFLYGR
jgi:hypothetical protein